VAILQPEATATRVPPSKAIRALDPDEIKLLTRRGAQFMAVGDLVTARTVLQRAAEAGDAAAAIAMGETYDPIVLAKLGVVGMGADVDKARTWYRKAESLGSAEAAKRLQHLANR
jgi:TPR repeat protein